MYIFVSQLPLSISEQELTELFAPFGIIESAYIVKDKHTGTPKGDAYVDMPIDAEAEQAIAKLHGSDYKGQKLRVSQAEATDFPSGEFW